MRSFVERAEHHGDQGVVLTKLIAQITAILLDLPGTEVLFHVGGNTVELIASWGSELSRIHHLLGVGFRIV